MHSFVLASVAIVTIRHINTQNLGDLPVCAQVAASAAIIQTGCAITDIACVCRGGQFLTALLEQECDETEQRGAPSPQGYQTPSSLDLVNELLNGLNAATYAFAIQLCAIAGVKLPASITALAAANPTTTATIAETVSPFTTEPISSMLSEAPISTIPLSNNNSISAITTNTTTFVPTLEIITSTSTLSSSAIVVTFLIPITITATSSPVGTPTITCIPVILSTIPPKSLSIMSALSSSIQSAIDISTATTVEAAFTPTPPPTITTTISNIPAASHLPLTSTLSDSTPTSFPHSSTTIPSTSGLPSSAIPSTPSTNLTYSTSLTGPSVQVFQPGSGALALPGRSWLGFFVPGAIITLLFRAFLSGAEGDVLCRSLIPLFPLCLV